MLEELEKLRSDLSKEIDKVSSLEVLEELRVKYLGKKGYLTTILKNMGSLSAEERPKMGKLANEIRDNLNDTINSFGERLKQEAINKRISYF